MFGLEPNDSLERRPGESSKAFEAFRVYRNLGPHRSVAKAGEIFYEGAPGKKRGSSVKVWSQKFEWRKRAEAFDAWLSLRDDAVLDRYRNEEKKNIAKREAMHRERTFENEERAGLIEAKMLDRFEKMLEQLPLVTQEVVKEVDGVPTAYIIKPAVSSPDLTIKRLHGVSSRGLPTKLEVGQNITVGSVSEEDREKIQKLRDDPDAGKFFSKLFPSPEQPES